MWVNKNNNTGFTIVETLIVLAVSGAMFVSIAALISGQIARNQSRQASDTIEIFVRDVLNDVSTGFYPETGQKFSCRDTGAAKPEVNLDAAAPARGSNPVCVLAGKKITFTNTNITVDTVVAFSTATISTPSTQLTEVDGLKQTKTYPYSVKRTGADKSYYVLNSLVSPAAAQDATFVGNVQKVGVVMGDNTSYDTGFVVCFDNASKLTFGRANDVNANIEQGVASCVET